ncbi:RHS repeat-associated core domain-containing protein [Pseudomonas sp. PD9R]|uniref:RHS repeat domain-containing protein n=1 Tax=Pseudomonas sp. PD9R TaxID=2853534 RepID=UPI001C48E35D|nr:RHS repeat protein [Pseudomonas sp. PD9R]
MTHANTPAIKAFDPRGLGVRGVVYHRRDGGSASESHITQQVHDAAGRAVFSRDPRLFRLHQAGQPAANHINVFNLTGTVLLSQNSDAGWRLGMLGEDGQSVEGWDQKLSHSGVAYDRQRRPVAMFERALDEPEHCTGRFSYADASADDGHNRRGQLIRNDDTAGTLNFTEFSIAGTLLQHSRTFIADPEWVVDWPEAEPERDVFLEHQQAVSRTDCNAAGEPVSQTDALGNRQTFTQTRAGELCEVRLKLAAESDEKTLVSEIQYNAFGQIERQRAGNGVISCATFRLEDGRLERLKAYVSDQPALQDLTYEYDAVGNITCISDAAEATRFHRNQRIEPSNRYHYDSLYRLIEASGRQIRNAPGGPQLPSFQCEPDPGQLENYTRTYTYDEAGNLKVMQHQAASASRTEHTAIAGVNNRSLPEKANGDLPDELEIAAGFDLNGNRLELQPGQDLRWDRRNQLCQVEQIVREDEPNDCECYVYDGSGLRQRKIRKAYTGTLTRTHETRYLPGVEIRTSADEVLHVITVRAGRGTVQVLHWEKRQPSGIPQDQQRYSFTDHLGSSTLELDEAALLISCESYYPYGGTCWWAGRNKLEAGYKTLRYSGQERDATGLYYYGFRYYVPWCQRWLNADPAGTADGLNLFAMVHGNPIRFVDMQGLSAGETLHAVTASAARELTSAFIASAAQYAATAVLNPINLGVTLTGAVLGGASGAVSGYATANWAQNRLSVEDMESWAPFIAKVSGAAMGAALGAAPSLVGHFNPSGNTAAATQIGGMFGALFRELSFQKLLNAGPNNVIPGGPDIVTGLSGSAAVGLTGGAAGYAGAILFGSSNAGRALQSTVITPLATMMGTGSSSLVRAARGAANVPAKQEDSPFNPAKGVLGVTSRHFLASLGQLANQAVEQMPGYSNLSPEIRAGLARAVGNAIGEMRLTYMNALNPGLFAELGQTAWDVESQAIGLGVQRENVPTSSSQAYDPAATEVFHMTSEPKRGQRNYKRSTLNF